MDDEHDLPDEEQAHPQDPSVRESERQAPRSLQTALDKISSTARRASSALGSLVGSVKSKAVASAPSNRSESGSSPKDDGSQGEDGWLDRAVQAVRENPWWVLSIVVSLAVAAFFVVALFKPGGLMGSGADARDEVETSIEGITVFPSDAMREKILGSSAERMLQQAGVDSRAFYDAVIANVSTEIKRVTTSGPAAQVVVAATHPDMDAVKTKWFERISGYPATDAGREEARNFTYEQRMAKVLTMLQECLTGPDVPLRTDNITLTVNRGPNGWHIANGGWERSVVFGGMDLAMMVEQNVIVEQPVAGELEEP